MRRPSFAVLVAVLAAASITFTAWSEVGAIRIGAFSQGSVGELPDEWEPLRLGNASPSRYVLVHDGDGVVLRAEADGAASGLVRRVSLDPARYPILAWRWRAENVIAEGDMDEKAGDDYPARIYVTFAYDPGDLSFGERLKYEATKALAGSDVPLRALSYVWTNHADETEPAPNPFTDWVQMIPVEQGAAHVGTWREERRNLYDDYRRVFGEDPPPISGIAVMTDADNTGAAASALYGDILLLRE